MARQTGQNRKARQEAVAVAARDLSTPEISSRIEHANTLIAMFESQRQRAQRGISEGNADVRTCDKMIDELRADVATLDVLVKARRA